MLSVGNVVCFKIRHILAVGRCRTMDLECVVAVGQGGDGAVRNGGTDEAFAGPCGIFGRVGKVGGSNRAACVAGMR